MDMGSGWVHITPLPVLYHVLKSRKTQTQSKQKKKKPIKLGLIWYPRIQILLPCLVTRLTTKHLMDKTKINEVVYRKEKVVLCFVQNNKDVLLIIKACFQYIWQNNEVRT